MAYGREGFVIGDLVRLRYPSHLLRLVASRTFKVISGPDHQGCYVLIPADRDDVPKSVTTHGEWLTPADGPKYHSVGRAIDTPTAGHLVDLERAAWAEVGMGPDELKAALFDNGVTDEED